MPDVGLSVRRAPTHVLRIDVPLYIVDPPAEPGQAPEFDAVAEALKIALALSRAAYVGAICNDAQVSLEMSDGGEPEHQGEPFTDENGKPFEEDR